MNLFILFRTTIGGEPEDSSGIDTISASGTKEQALAMLPNGDTERKLTDEEDSFLECNVGDACKLLEVTSPGVATVLSTTWFYPPNVAA